MNFITEILFLTALTIKSKKMKKIQLLILFIISTTNLIIAQDITGDIYGRIFDFTTKQPIPFANVLVLETNFGAATNDEGFFKIEKLAC